MSVNLCGVSDGFVALDYRPDNCDKLIDSDRVITFQQHGTNRGSSILPRTLQNLMNSFNGIFNIKRTSSVQQRDLPPLPNEKIYTQVLPEKGDIESEELPKLSEESKSIHPLDFASSILKVKDYGWYWGPLSSTDAEKILSKEPDGSFIVRDSSDQHHIFSITFKLRGVVRHVRIEHNEGNFSFESFSLFRRRTIVDFVESAVEHSRSGRYLFFLQRRPILGPMRVQLLHPVSRFKTVPSLQHFCRFQILKHVRRDLIGQLPLPSILQAYLNTSYYYTEDWELTHKTNTPLRADNQLSSDYNAVM